MFALAHHDPDHRMFPAVQRVCDSGRKEVANSVGESDTTVGQSGKRPQPRADAFSGFEAQRKDRSPLSPAAHWMMKDTVVSNSGTHCLI